MFKKSTMTRQKSAGLAIRGPWLGFCLAVLLIFFSNLAVAAPTKPLKELVSYQEFSELVMITVAKVPDLKQLWDWQQRTGYAVHFGGGVFRGLLHWLYIQLQTHTPEEVRAMDVPEIAELQLQTGSDVDFFIPDVAKPFVKDAKFKVPPDQLWDALTDTFHQQNVLMGGASLEKIRANPFEIDDQLNGLKDYYEGELVFINAPEEVFKNVSWVARNGQTKITEALRFIRFSFNLPEVEPTAESIATIQSLAALEGGRLDEEEETHHWIRKALRKLHIATGKNIGIMMLSLKRYNLLTILGNIEYDFGNLEKIGPYLSLWHQNGFSVQELKSAARISTNDIDQIKDFMEQALKYVTSAEDFITITQYQNYEPSAHYIDFTNKYIVNHLDFFFGLKPSLEQVKRFEGQHSRASINVQLFSRSKHLITNAEDFIALVRYPHPYTSPEYRQRSDDWAAKNLNLFFSFDPSFKQIMTLLKSNYTSINLKIKVLENFLPKLNTPQQFIWLAQRQTSAQTKYDQQLNSEWLNKNLNHFLSLNPTPEQARDLINSKTLTKEIKKEIKQKLSTYLKSKNQNLPNLFNSIKSACQNLLNPKS